MAIADAAARSCTLNTSPMQAETIVIIAEPLVPARSLMMIRLGMFGAKEQPRRTALKKAVEQLTTSGRP
jgi:hypothetical protein